MRLQPRATWTSSQRPSRRQRHVGPGGRVGQVVEHHTVVVGRGRRRARASRRCGGSRAPPRHRVRVGVAGVGERRRRRAARPPPRPGCWGCSSGRQLAGVDVEHPQGAALVAAGGDAVGHQPAVGRGVVPVDGGGRVAVAAAAGRRSSRGSAVGVAGRGADEQDGLVEAAAPLEGEQAVAGDPQRRRPCARRAARSAGRAEPAAAGQGVEHGAGAVVLGRGPGPHLVVGSVLQPAVGVGDLDAVQHVDDVVSPRRQRRRVRRWPLVVATPGRYRQGQGLPSPSGGPAGLARRARVRTSGPPWLSMGLSRCAPAGWLVPDEHRDEELVERGRLLAERHDEVFGALPGHRGRRRRDAGPGAGLVRRAPPDLDRCRRTPEDVHPLEAAGRLVQEDLCLMVVARRCAPPRRRLPVLPVALAAGRQARPAGPARCTAPCPRYDDGAGREGRPYLTRLRPGVIGVRRNWSVHDSPVLFAARPPPDSRAAHRGRGAPTGCGCAASARRCAGCPTPAPCCSRSGCSRPRSPRCGAARRGGGVRGAHPGPTRRADER